MLHNIPNSKRLKVGLIIRSVAFDQSSLCTTSGFTFIGELTMAFGDRKQQPAHRIVCFQYPNQNLQYSSADFVQIVDSNFIEGGLFGLQYLFSKLSLPDVLIGFDKISCLPARRMCQKETPHRSGSNSTYNVLCRSTYCGVIVLYTRATPCSGETSTDVTPMICSTHLARAQNSRA
jgi:hypothetical protein